MLGRSVFTILRMFCHNYLVVTRKQDACLCNKIIKRNRIVTILILILCHNTYIIVKE